MPRTCSMRSSHDGPRAMLAGAAAGFVAGGLLSASWLAIEAATGETSEVVRLGRLCLAKVRRTSRPEPARADFQEQALSHGGHLILSAAAGGVYGLVAPADASPWRAGCGFGAGFYVVAYGILAPMLGLRAAMWNEAAANVVQRGFFHLLFGILIAWLTPAVARRL